MGLSGLCLRKIGRDEGSGEGGGGVEETTAGEQRPASEDRGRLAPPPINKSASPATSGAPPGNRSGPQQRYLRTTIFCTSLRPATVRRAK